MKIYFASDHAGFETKNALVEYVRRLGYEVEDCGAHTFDETDDYPAIIAFGVGVSGRELECSVNFGVGSRSKS